MPERDVERYGLVDEPRHVEYSFFLADDYGFVSFRVGFAEMSGKPVGCLYGLIHVVETKVARHRHRADGVEQQFKEVIAAVDGQLRVQLSAPHVGRVNGLKERIVEVKFHDGLALGKVL